MTLNRKLYLLEDSCFCAIVAVTVFLILVIAQTFIPDNQSTMEFLAKSGSKFLGLCFFILFFPWALKSFDAKKGLRIESETLPICIAILIPIVLGYFCTTDFSLISSLLGGGLSIFAFFDWMRNAANKKKCFLIFVLGVVMGFCISSILFADKYHHIYFLQRLGFGATSTDTLYHSAILNISKNYDKLSIGIDGAPYTPYHMGSHWVFAQWCKLLGANGLSFYLVGFACLSVPLLLKAMLTLGEKVSSIFLQKIEFKGNDHSLSLYRFPILILGFATFLPNPVARAVGLWRSVLTSESYAMSITLFVFSLSLIIEFFITLNSKSNKKVTGDLVFSAIGIITLLALGSWCKLSMGFVTFVFLGYLTFRHIIFARTLSIEIKFLSLLPMVGGALFAFIVYLSAKFPYQSGIAPFAFISTFIKPHLIPFHILLFYGWIWIFAAYFYFFRGKTDEQLSDQFKVERLALEALLILGLICTIPSSIIDLPAGDIISFMEPQYWLSICFVLALTYTCFHTLTVEKIESFKKMLIALTVFAILNTCITGALFVQEILKAEQMIALKRNECSVLRSAIKFFDELDQIPFREKRELGVYVPQSIEGYWTSMPPISIAFVIPAVSGLIALDGLPPKGFEPSIYYGYWNFNFGRRVQDFSKYDLDTFSTVAVAKGIKKIIFVESADFKFKKIDCYDIFLKGHQKK